VKECTEATQYTAAQRVIHAFDRHLDHFIEESYQRIIAAEIPTYTSLPPDRARALIASAFPPFRADLYSPTLDPSSSVFQEHWNRIGPSRATRGGVQDILQGTYIILDYITEFFRDDLFADDDEACAWWSMRMFQIVFPGMMALVESYSHAREQVIRDQVWKIRQLSTPIVPVHNGILILPLVGELDEQRATQMMEAVLEALFAHEAEYVIIDITGVAFVDNTVANHLIQTAKAANLLGSHVVLAGISPAVAQTMVHLCVDFATIQTCANLQMGIAYALRQQGLALVQASEIS
jgi:anti-anti-sigma factor